ncbi:6-bladed beta-propeller [Parabacteroides hominis]|uniref:6-bladed beta-propeller n=1 Tax=Parabacteroides hominis TaxID=2763057 RepID=A0ABR7DR64_9BACT|nr:6-bladed beta-propeller [Parabacteroides hominis]MBC5633891.1 6-bladed beta-propeller [Parabacteroides hominis]
MKFKVLILFLLLSCVQSAENEREIPFANGIENVQEINVSDIALDVRYIALETNSDCLLGKDLYDISFSEKYLFVRDDSDLYQFTLEGKFIRKIGKKGQGPKEFLMISSVKYDNQKEEIYMNDLLSGKIKVYSFDGDFMRDILTENGEQLIYYNTDDKLFYMYPMFFYNEQESNELIVRNEKGEELYVFPFFRDGNVKYPSFLISQSIIYTYNGIIYYKNPLESVIFRLDNDKKTPMYNLSLGRYENLSLLDDVVVEKKGNIGFGEFNKEAEDKLSFYDIFELQNYVCFFYLQHDRRFAWYNKVNNSVCRIRGRSAKIDGFTDDLQNGYPILPRFWGENRIVGYVSAGTLIEEMRNNKMVDGSLRQVMTNLSEEDNPVLQVVTLK